MLRRSGAAMFLAQFADFLRLARIRIKHRRCADLQRQPENHRVAEAVEERQHAEQTVLGHERQMIGPRRRIAGRVAVRQRDSLRLAGAAAGEDDRRHVVELVPAESEHDVLEEPAGQEQHREERANPLPFRDFGECVFEMDDVDAVEFERHRVEESFRSDDRTHAGLPDRRATWHRCQPCSSGSPSCGRGSSDAMFAMRPPTLVGSQRPTFCSVPIRGLSQRAMHIEPTSAFK